MFSNKVERRGTERGKVEVVVRVVGGRVEFSALLMMIDLCGTVFIRGADHIAGGKIGHFRYKG